MGSIRIHQDVYNFERKRNGFTARQWMTIGGAFVAAVAASALSFYALRLMPVFGLFLIAIAVTPFVIVGFFPIQRMPAEKYLEKKAEMDDRGDAITFCGEKHADAKPILSAAHIKASKKPGHENEVHEALIESCERIEESNALFEAQGKPDWSGHDLYSR